MKTARALPFILIAGAFLSGPASAGCWPAGADVVRIAAVENARTVALADTRLIRPAGIESFALMGADGEAADRLLAERLAGLLAGRQAEVVLVDGRTDRHGRRAAFIVADGRLVQAQLAAEGLALAFPDGGGEVCMADILAAEAAAREERAGLWAEFAVLPAEPGALSSYLGRYVIFEGEVLSVGNRSRRTYLNFGRRWSEDVTVVIESRDRDTFGGAEALEALAGRRVRVRGFAEERGGPMVTVRRAGQIEVLEPLESGRNGS